MHRYGIQHTTGFKGDGIFLFKLANIVLFIAPACFAVRFTIALKLLTGGLHIHMCIQ